MTDELPPLPDPFAYHHQHVLNNSNGIVDSETLASPTCEPLFPGQSRVETIPLYTADQLRAAVLAERERCAKVCEEIETAAWKEWKATYNTYHDGRSDGAGECAAAIRAGTKSPG